MKFTVRDPDEPDSASPPERGQVALVVRGGDPEVHLVPAPGDRIVAEPRPRRERSSGDPDREERPHTLRLRVDTGAGESEGLPSLLRRLADALEPDRPSELRIRDPGEGSSIRVVRNPRPPGLSNDRMSDAPGDAEPPVDHERLEAMCHELRTPINAVVGYVALLRERVYGDLNPEQGAAVERIRSAAEHLVAALRHLFEMADLDLGEFHVTARSEPPPFRPDEPERLSGSGAPDSG